MMYTEAVGTKASRNYLTDKELWWSESENSAQIQQLALAPIINKAHGRIPRSPDVRDQITGVSDAASSHLLINAVKMRGA